MLKPKFKILLSILLVLMLITSYCLATAEPSTTEETTVTTTNEAPTEGEGSEAPQSAAQNWIYEDLFELNDNIKMANVVDGNAFIIGKDVTISGEIGGDLFVIADKLTIEGGYVYSSVFALANEINLNGTVYDLYAACNTFNLQSNGFVYRDMKLAATNANILGRVRRNANITTNNLTFADNAGELISGNLNYSAPKEITIPEGVVAGEVKFSQESTEKSEGNPVVSKLLSLVKSLLFTFVATIVLLWLTPKFVERVGNTSINRAFVALGIGLIAPICLGIACFILLFSIVGLPILACAMFAFAILAFSSKVITSIFFGKLLTKKLNAEGNFKLILYTLLVTLAIWLIGLIPVIGTLIGSIASIFGIGLTLVNMISKKSKVQD